jgi:hypothetical protein
MTAVERVSVGVSCLTAIFEAWRYWRARREARRYHAAFMRRLAHRDPNPDN